MRRKMKSENLSYKTIPSSLNKKVIVPTSKSYANRVLILAALNSEEVTIKNLPESTDVKNMLKCFEEIGLKLKIENNKVTVLNSFPECENISSDTIHLHTGDGGTTNRFLIPLLALGKNRYNLIPAEKMTERPMKEMESILLSLGVKLFNEENWFCLQGPYNSSLKEIEVDCSETTQFATGFMLSLWKTGINVNEINLKTSIPYLLMTKELIKDLKNEYTVPVDFSSLSYPLALGALGGEVHIPNCVEVDRYQADSILIEILKSLSVEITINDQGLSLKGIDSMDSFEHDCSACPDLVPTLCFLASYAKGDSHLKKVDVLKYKECDRLKEMLRMMKLFDVDASYDEKSDVLTVRGRESHNKEVEVKTERDHRMVMVAHLFQRYNGGGILHDSDCVKKSFPQFFKEMND